MKIRFWGTRGSYPASCSAVIVRDKLDLLMERAFEVFPEKIEKQAWADFLKTKIPFYLRGTYGTNTLCVQIETGIADEFILCDAGTGIIEFGKYVKSILKQPTGNTFHIFLSHLHWDHIQGFPFFVLNFGKDNRIIIHGYHEKTKETFNNMMSASVFPIPLSQVSSEVIFDIKKSESIFDLGYLKTRGIIQNHPGISYGYKIESGNKILIYSTDCEHSKGERSLNHPFIRFCKNADLLIFDAMSSFSEMEQVGWGHSTYKVGVEIATWSCSKKLVFFHHDPDCNDMQLDSLPKLAKEYELSYRDQNPNIKISPPLEIFMAYDTLELEI